MELALILVVGGLAWWLMRPLRDWYVVETCRATGDTGKQIFPELDAAEQSWTHSLQTLREAQESGTVSLWHIEARSRRLSARNGFGESIQAAMGGRRAS